MHRRIKPYEAKVHVGNRVLVDVPTIRLRQPGTVVGQRTKFAATPKLREIMCLIHLDNKVFGHLTIDVREIQCHVLQSESET